MIPFVDLKAQYDSIKPEVDAAILGVLESCQFTLGNEVAAFEKEFAAYSSSVHAAGVNNGTSALHLALLAAGIGAWLGGWLMTTYIRAGILLNVGLGQFGKPLPLSDVPVMQKMAAACGLAVLGPVTFLCRRRPWFGLVAYLGTGFGAICLYSVLLGPLCTLAWFSFPLLHWLATYGLVCLLRPTGLSFDPLRWGTRRGRQNKQTGQ